MNSETAITSVSPEELFSMSQRGGPVELIDVSTGVEHRELRVPFARNLPIGSAGLKAWMEGRRVDCARPVYVMCRGGVRSLKVCRAYPEANLVNVEGGTRKWTDCGLPVKRDRGVMSLERQVRMAAGGLVLLGAILSATVHPYFVMLCAFVGGGLFVAGATNTCGMAMVLALMPWNRGARTAASELEQSYSN